MSSAPKRCNAPKQRKKRGNAHIHFGFLRIYTAFHTFLTRNSHICKKKRNVSAKQRFGKNKKNGFARNAREFISIKSLQKNKKGGGKTHIHLGVHAFLQLFTHHSPEISTSVFCKKKPSARKHFSKKKKNSAAKKRFRTHRAQIFLKFSNHSSTQKKHQKGAEKCPSILEFHMPHTARAHACEIAKF